MSEDDHLHEQQKDDILQWSVKDHMGEDIEDIETKLISINDQKAKFGLPVDPPPQTSSSSHEIDLCAFPPDLFHLKHMPFICILKRPSSLHTKQKN